MKINSSAFFVTYYLLSKPLFKLILSLGYTWAREVYKAHDGLLVGFPLTSSDSSSGAYLKRD
ncbi:hypothetical protein LSAJ156_400006 [Latilactobacillus sakei]|nr:hypothetical protein LSAJ160_240023 [Latilactobacillus sakei]SOB40041.1 hypothetical protein LSAJ18_200094 [Latilactobacillus sakei]SOB40316.1 hypothetical protein LSAJ156_400006 [Latilactobacillus sakei]SOB44160.1 hypothetical protein LSAJ112_290008 [Latilactobacillus sakei]SON71932.1 protein of unknown function [Latilactobacillus sakei]